MKTNKKLTMKQLKEELEQLKASKIKSSSTNSPLSGTHGSGIGHDIKNSYINRMYMKSSLMMLWIFSWVIALANRIPMIRYLIGLLSLWYGRTTWWKILVRILSISRKTFVVFNALIGIYVVYSLCGFEVGLMFSHFATMGHTYLEIFSGFTKRIFEWFLDILGYDIGPNKPNIPSGHVKRFWNIGDIPKMPDYNYGNGNSLRDTYKSLLNINVETVSTPWYRDLTTWLWIGGIISIIGVSYLGYKFIMDPNFFTSDLTPTIRRPRGPGGDIPPYFPDNTVEPGIIENIGNGLKSMGSKVVSGVKLLNPYSWFTSTVDTKDLVNQFNAVQVSENYDKKYFPFTPIHPYDPWYTNLRIKLFGETTSEYALRTNLKRNVLNNIIGIPKGSPVNSPLTINNSLMNLPPISPHINTIGLGTRFTSGLGLYEKIDATTSAAALSEKLSSIPSTPINVPSNLPNVEHLNQSNISDLDEINIWQNHDRQPGGIDIHRWKINSRQFRFNEVAGMNINNK
jgi:hypothetical protein